MGDILRLYTLPCPDFFTQALIDGWMDGWTNRLDGAPRTTPPRANHGVEFMDWMEHDLLQIFCGLCGGSFNRSIDLCISHRGGIAAIGFSEHSIAWLHPFSEIEIAIA